DGFPKKSGKTKHYRTWRKQSRSRSTLSSRRNWQGAVQLLRRPRPRRLPTPSKRSANRFEPASQFSGLPINFEQCIISCGEKEIAKNVIIFCKKIFFYRNSFLYQTQHCMFL